MAQRIRYMYHIPSRSKGFNRYALGIYLQVLVTSLAGIGSFLMCLSAFLYILFNYASNAHAADARVKDIVNIEGVRDNLLVGYGLVVGLNGTGDNLKNSVFTQKGLEDLLSRMGVNTRGSNLKTKNVAAVTITAKLPPFSRQGSRIDVSVSTLGDAKSLQGGTLLATPLLGADGEVYAVAQGPLSIGGFQATSPNSTTSISKGVSTGGFVPNGAIVEKEIDFDLNSLNSLSLALKNPDISTAKNIADAINGNLSGNYAKASDPGTVELSVPNALQGNVLELLASIEQIEVPTDQPARIVVDEASGTIVMGENVKIDTVAVAQGNLIVKVGQTPLVSQPNPFAPEGAQTVVTAQENISVNENEDKKLAVLEEGATLKDLVNGLNALGVGPRDMITILETIKAAGALQAEIEVR